MIYRYAMNLSEFRGEMDIMKAFLAAVAFAVIVAAAAPFLLPGMQSNSSSAFTTAGVRLDDPGSNLIGKN